MGKFILGVVTTVTVIVLFETSPIVEHDIRATREYDAIPSRMGRLKWLATHIIWTDEA